MGFDEEYLRHSEAVYTCNRYVNHDDTSRSSPYASIPAVGTYVLGTVKA